MSVAQQARVQQFLIAGVSQHIETNNTRARNSIDDTWELFWKETK